MVDGSVELVVTIIGVAAPIAVSLFSFYRGFSKPYDQRRYDEIIAPLFVLLEPYLFKESGYQRPEVQEAVKLIEEKRAIAGGKLLMAHYFLAKTLSQYNFHSLCDAVNLEYDRLSRRLGVPVRTSQYRLLHKQYRNKEQYYLATIGRVLYYLSLGVLWMFFGLLFFCVLSTVIASGLQKLFLR